MEPDPQRQLRAQAQAGFLLWLINVGVGSLVARLWLLRVPEDLTLGLHVYNALALVCSIASFAVIPGGLFYLAQRYLRRPLLVGLAQAGVGSLFLCLIYTDTVVKRLLGYHLNSAFLNVVFTEGSGDAIHLGPYVWLTSAGVGALLVALEYQLWSRAYRRALQRQRDERPMRWLLRPQVVLLAVLLPLTLLVKGIWGWAELTGNHDVLHASEDIPGFKLRPSQVGGGKGLLGHDLRPEEARLSWPREAPELPADGPRPNLMLMVLDSWRADAFTPELTPELDAFAQGALRFDDHVSSGNATRYGLFGMLYGLHGAYWERVLEDRRSPVLVDALLAAGYEVRVFSAASMSFPEFRSTAWVELPEGAVLDSFVDAEGRPLTRRSDVKDALVAEGVEDWLERRAHEGDERPFFCFVLLDSPHQPYFNPGGPHQPSEEELNYIELGTTAEGPELAGLQERVRNAYLNSVLYADGVAGDVLDSLRRHDELDDTVVVVTGDHGEEFYEHGFWGHTSNFTPEQVRVPLYLRGPGVEPGRVDRPTSHVDLSNSLLELLGADPAKASGYSLGHSLFDPLEHRTRVVGAWAHLGVWTDSGIFQLPFVPERDLLRVYDDSWMLLSDTPALVEREREVLDEVAEECVRFLDPPWTRER